MLASRWILLLVYPHAVGATECLVGCLVQGIDPFDVENLAVWDDRAMCDALTVGCAVSAINYPSSTIYQGALWASTFGADGDDDCSCSICDPYPWGDTTGYMAEDPSLWNRIHCFLAASESSGYDVSPCVAAIADTGTLPCVDDVYEAPTVDQFECEENRIVDLATSSSWEVCNWNGDPRGAQELFSGTSESSSTTGTANAVNTIACLVGCLVQGISPFDEDSLAVWDNRATCDTQTIGCEVSAINYPSTLYQGALWASSWGSDGSSSCTCSICDPYPWGDTTSYMAEDPSLWNRIHCYLVASEASGYDVSPCVAAIVDTGTLPCVDDVYEAPTVGQFECEENRIKDLTTSESWVVCYWAGVARSTDELFDGTRTPSPLPGPTTAPVPLSASDVTPQPSTANTASPDLPGPTTAPVPLSASDVTPQPSTANTASPDPTPTAPSLTPPPSTNSPQPGITSTDSPNLTPSVTSPLGTNAPQPVISGPASSDPTPTPSMSPLPTTDGSTPPVEVEGEGVSCAVGSVCLDDFCCHPDTNTCGRKYTYCQVRDFLDGPRCCSGVNGDPSASNVCSEDSICDKPEGDTTAEVVGLWVGIVAGLFGIIGVVVGWRKCCR